MLRFTPKLPEGYVTYAPIVGTPFHLIPNEGIGDCHYLPELPFTCSIVEEVFYAKIEIYYEPTEFLLEVVSFDEWLKSIGKEETFTVESLCRRIFDTVQAALGDIRMAVSVTATTTVHAPLQATIYSEAFKHE